MTNYCIGCGYITESEYIVCFSCSALNDVPECFAPITCGDDVCYLLPNGEMNLDGDCEHADAIYSLFPNTY
jgi:hypothetical protein